MRILRRRKRRREKRLSRSTSPNFELDIIQAFKDEDFIRCASLLKKMDEEGFSSDIIEGLKPKILEKLENENINIY